MRPILTMMMNTEFCYGLSFTVLIDDVSIEFFKWTGDLLINGVSPRGKYTLKSYNRIFVKAAK